MRPQSGPTRRRYLQFAGLATVAGLAGCNRDTGNEGLSGQEYPEADEWLTETDVGAEASNYDGSLVDQRVETEVTINVGTAGDGAVFDPVAVVVSPTATVRWTWTGEGGAHNVVAAPGDQLEESDYEFSSGDPVEGGDESYEEQLDNEGVVLYHCGSHLEDGMKGAVVVEEDL